MNSKWEAQDLKIISEKINGGGGAFGRLRYCGGLATCKVGMDLGRVDGHDEVWITSTWFQRHTCYG